MKLAMAEVRPGAFGLPAELGGHVVLVVRKVVHLVPTTGNYWSPSLCGAYDDNQTRRWYLPWSEIHVCRECVQIARGEAQ